MSVMASRSRSRSRSRSNTPSSNYSTPQPILPKQPLPTKPRALADSPERTKIIKKRTYSSNLSTEQKKENHIQSEQKRRQQIRATFDKLVDIVPTLNIHESRSELVIMDKTSEYIEELRADNSKLIEKASKLGINIPKELLEKLPKK